MIIDVHAHIAHWPSIQATTTALRNSMEKNGIVYSLISNADAAEFPDRKELTSKGFLPYPSTQEEALKITLGVVKRHPERYGALVWVNPGKETVTKELIELIESNRRYIKGLKIHPFCSHVKMTNHQKVYPFLDLAREFSLPVLVHTARDRYSDVFYLGLAAEEFKDVTFIAAHMELMGDPSRAIDVLEKHENIYGDTAWLPLKWTKRAIERLGRSRLMFGTDNPIDGALTLENPLYKEYFENSENLNKIDYESLMWGNANRIFNLGFKK